MKNDLVRARQTHTATDLPAGFAQAVAMAGFGVATQWGRLQGGRTNQVFWGEFTDKKLVFKIFNTDRKNHLFPNDIKCEHASLVALDKLNLAPKFRGRFRFNGLDCLAYDFVKGEVAQIVSKEAIQALAILHQQPPPKKIRRLACDRDAVLAQGLMFVADDRSERAAYLRDACPSSPNFMPVDPCFLHGDPTPANTIETETGIIFVDWQCPAVGDPVYDLVLAVSPAMQLLYGNTSCEKVRPNELISAYGDSQIIDRYAQLAPLLSWRIACYCHWKSRRGEVEYAAAGLAEFS
jgi:hypothetical protein